jgi:hypothetical protein
MKKKIWIILAAAFGAVLVLLAGAGLWAYSNGYYHALRGGIAQGNKDYDGAISFFEAAYEKNPQAFMVAHDIACCYAVKGDRESCFRWLGIALRSSYAEYARKYARTEHDFDPVRRTPEFQSLIGDPAR